MATQTAKLRFLRMAPRKVRLVASVLRGMSVNDAEAQLMLQPRRAAKPLLKLLRSAIANAKERKLDPNKLIVGSIRVDEGKALKRLLPQGRGRANLIRKRFSHITVELVESEKAKPKGFLMPKKVKKVKELHGSRRPAPRPTEERAVPKEQKGFMQRVFRRKAV